MNSDDPLPPLLALLSQSSSSAKNVSILSDVQFLLDFVIAGFGKCGTTTLLKWMVRNNETNPAIVEASPVEPTWLQNNKPSEVVRHMYLYMERAQHQHQQNSSGTPKPIYAGFKNPALIRQPYAYGYLAQYWPNTPVIVTVRHPVHWMQSLYNFHLIEQNGYRHLPKNRRIPLKQILNRQRENGTETPFVSSTKGEFHAILARLGRTALQDEEEWKLLEPWVDRSTFQTKPLPNPIFLLEMSQLNDTDTGQKQQLAHDLEVFLGFPQGQLDSSPSFVRPKGVLTKKRASQLPPRRKHHTKGLAERIHWDDIKMNICDEEWDPVLQEMMAIARSSSDWLQHYLLQSPGVSSSSPRHLAQLLEAWKINPCNDPIQKRSLMAL